MHARMVEYLGDPAFLDRIGNHFTILRAEPTGARVEVRPNIWRDQFGVHWDRSVDQDIGVVMEYLVTPENLRDFAFPDADDPSRFAACAHVRRTVRRLRRNQYLVQSVRARLDARGDGNAADGHGGEPRLRPPVADRLLEFNCG